MSQTSHGFRSGRSHSSQRRMDEKDKITIDRGTFKALAADSRIEILKMLDEHKLTLTDLAQKLGMSPSTVKEHLDRLDSAGLIELIPGDTKWKYYRLTRKGRNILNPYETRVWFVLTLSLVSLAGVVYSLFGKIAAMNSMLQGRAYEAAGNGVALLSAECPADASVAALAQESGKLSSNTTTTLIEKAGTALTAKAGDMVSTTTTTLARAVDYGSQEAGKMLSGIPLEQVALALFLMLVIGLCVGLLVRKRAFI